MRDLSVTATKTMRSGVENQTGRPLQTKMQRNQDEIAPQIEIP